MLGVLDPTRPMVLVLLAVLLGSSACDSSEPEDEATVASAASPRAYFEALNAWSADLSTRMEAVDQGEPNSDEPSQHAHFRQRRIDALLALSSDLGGIEPAARTADAHRDLLDGLEGLLDLEARIIESLEGAASASEVFDGPLLGEMEAVGGRVLGVCQELLDLARKGGFRAELFCGSTEE